MGISLIEDVPEPTGNLAQLEKDLGEAVSLSQAKQPQGKQEQKPVVPDEDANLDPKYRGKTKAEIAEMHKNAESRLGTMANDLGTQRKLTDRLLDLKREEDLSRNTPPAKVSRADLLESDDPTPVLDRFVEARVSRTEAQVNERLARVEQSMQATAFAAKHPDYATVSNDQKFVQWVQQSQYRTRLAAQAVQQSDWGAADELLTEFKLQAAVKVAPTQKQEDNLDEARRASLESGSGAGKSQDAPSGKVYRRADLIRLRMSDPEKYYSDDFQAEIMRAYQEKRVR